MSGRKTPQEESVQDSSVPPYTLNHSQLQVISPDCQRAQSQGLSSALGTHFGVCRLEGDEKGNPTFLPGERIKMKRFFFFSSARSSWHLS